MAESKKDAKKQMPLRLSAKLYAAIAALSYLWRANTVLARV